MELAYLPDGLLYINGRTSVQQNFWTDVNRIECPEKKYVQSYDPKISEKNCHICRDKKMKSLSDYIRLKARRDSEPATQIREEDEDRLKRIADRMVSKRKSVPH